MTRRLKEIQKKICGMDFAERLGEALYDAIQEDGNCTYDMGKGIISVLLSCETERDFLMANDAVCAICGYDIESLIERMERRDADYAFPLHI